MTVSWTDIRDLPSGEFSTVAQSAIERVLAEAAREVSASAYGDRYDDAVLYLTAHLLAGQKKGSAGAAGPVTMEIAGPVTRQYSQMALQGGDEALLSTSYGRRFRDIRHQCVSGPRVL
jgi:hypothetical protein